MTDAFSLTGRKALVTGANTGIGQAIAVGLAQAGAEVVCAGRRSCDETEVLIAAAGGKASSVLVDFADPMAGQGHFNSGTMCLLNATRAGRLLARREAQALARRRTTRA